jgi:hypothetical protein
MNNANGFEYETPVGTFSTWEQAAAACERSDMDPCDCIEIKQAEPVAVAYWSLERLSA